MSHQERNDIKELNQKKNFLGKLSELFINRYRMSYLLIVFITVLGVMGYYALPRESMPYVTMPMAFVSTGYPGASPLDVEKLVTDPIEEKAFEMDDVKEVTSTSYLGFSSVTVTFNEGVDIEEKKTLLKGKVDEINFPSTVTSPTVSIMSTASSPIMSLSVSGDYDTYALTQFAEKIESKITRIKGVGSVEVLGGLERKINIYISPVKLQNYGVTTDDIRQALEQVNINTPLGSYELDNLYYNLRVDEQFKTLDEIGQVVIKNSAGNLIMLNEIAELVDGSSSSESYAGVYQSGLSEKPETLPSVNIDVYREDSSDVVGTSNDIRDMLEKEKGVIYPEGVLVDVTYDNSIRVQQDLADVIENVFSGLAVVIIVLFLFIGFSESLIVAFVIPLVMLSTLAVMNALGITLNGLSILGLIVSLGLLVDNAIVIMENVDRMRHKGLNRKIASIVGTNQVAMSVFAATLTTVAAFVPMTTMSGVIGKFLRSIPEVVVIAVSISLLVSLLITPVLCSRHLPKKKAVSKYKDTKWMQYLPVVLIIALSLYAFRIDGSITISTILATLLFASAMIIKQNKYRDKNLEDAELINWYEKSLSKLLDSKKRMVSLILAGIIALGAAGAMLPLGFLKVGTFPETDPTSVTISLTASEGTTLETMLDITEQVQERLYNVAEIENFNVSVGGNDKHLASVTANFVDKSLRTKTGLELLDEIRGLMADVTGARLEIVYDTEGMGSTYAIDIQVRGDNLDEVKNIAENYKGILNEIEGVESVSLSSGEGIPQIQFQINNNKSKALGLSATEIANELRTYISGATMTTVKLDNTEIDVDILLKDNQLLSTEDLKRLYIRAADGSSIPVTSVAVIEQVKGVSQIAHIDTSRVIRVQSNVLTGYNTNLVLNTFKERIADLPLSSNIDVKYGGEASDMDVNFTELMNSMWIAVFLVFTILAIQFNSIKQPFVIVAAVPMALIGVIFGLIITGNEFGLYAFMGLVSLVGIAVNDAIVLVDYINYLRKEGVPIKEAILEAGKTRFIPVFTTSLTTCGGILPLALKNPYYAQLGYSLVFGLMVATVLTLVFIPVLYILFEGRKDRFKETLEDTLIFEQMEV